MCTAHIPGYVFEYVPTPLASGGVGMFIDESLDYRILEKTSNEAFQVLWTEFSFVNKKNVICGIFYRQHNSPEVFQSYFDETIVKFASSGKHNVIMGDFNIDLLKCASSSYSHDFFCHPFKVVFSFPQSTNQHVFALPPPPQLITSLLIILIKLWLVEI